MLLCRLPLRSKIMADSSELSDRIVTLDVLDSLLEKFKHEMFDCLLFVNNVNTIGDFNAGINLILLC